MENKEPAWAKYITQDSIDNPELLYLIPIIGFEATKKLMLHCAGTPIFIPKTIHMKYKHQYILDNYDGTKMSRIKMVLDCNTTESYLYKIIKKYKDKKAL